MLDYERLHVYQRALQFFTLVNGLLARLPPARGDLTDQLNRAALSIPLNIAEGSGKPTAADRKRYRAIARGSAMECGALVDVLRVQGKLSAEEHGEAKGLLVEIVAMLSKMCR